MIYYAIRHIKTQQLMPEARHRRGYSHWNPDNDHTPWGIFLNTPRLLESKKQANKVIVGWFTMPNSKNKYFGDDEDLDINDDGRKKEDLEVIKIELRIRK